MRKNRGGGFGTKTRGGGKTAVRTTMRPVFGRGVQRSSKGRSGGRSR